jgi:L-amino acid N-acyltransferase YncA
MRRLLIPLVVMLWGCDLVSSSEATEPLSEFALSAHIEFLAGDSLYGRGSATYRELQAAQYIAAEFSRFNLEPGVLGYLQEFSVQDSSSRNVLGVVPGQGDLSGQWVVVGAHYDHLGFNQLGQDSIVIYNGADDNASGTALLLELARYMSHYFMRGEGENDARRSILFQAFGSEEVGLLGSRHFVENPTAPLDSVVAMVNLDMVGRMTNDMLMVAGSGSSPTWTGLLEQVNDEGLNIVYDDGGLQRSDQFPFLAAGIPVLFFTTGLHSDWHQPTDDSWLINSAGIVRVGDLVLEVLASVVESEERL